MSSTVHIRAHACIHQTHVQGRAQSTSSMPREMSCEEACRAHHLLVHDCGGLGGLLGEVDLVGPAEEDAQATVSGISQMPRCTTAQSRSDRQVIRAYLTAPPSSMSQEFAAIGDSWAWDSTSTIDSTSTRGLIGANSDENSASNAFACRGTRQQNGVTLSVVSECAKNNQVQRKEGGC